MSYTRQLADLYHRKEKRKIETITEGIKLRKQELDKFFEEYLELFDEKMSATEDQNAPIWKAYNARYKEWQKLNADLKLATYYLGMI